MVVLSQHTHPAVLASWLSYGIRLKSANLRQEAGGFFLLRKGGVVLVVPSDAITIGPVLRLQVHRDHHRSSGPHQWQGTSSTLSLSGSGCHSVQSRWQYPQAALSRSSSCLHQMFFHCKLPVTSLVTQVNPLCASDQPSDSSQGPSRPPGPPRIGLSTRIPERHG